jgi:death on curing protein
MPYQASGRIRAIGWSQTLPAAARRRAHPRPRYSVRDYGLLEAALARPQARPFGKDAYPDLVARAAALLHSIARNRALIDGNKRLALAAVIAFYGLNGRRLTLTSDAAYDLIISVASGQLDTVDAIAAVLQTATGPRK